MTRGEPDATRPAPAGLAPIRFTPGEWLGALGDLPVLVPLFLAMDRAIDFPLARSFFFVGAAYLFCGFYYRLPIPVQPLKAMAAAVLAQGLPFDVIRWAALFIGLILLGGSRFAAILARLFTRPTVKGIQLALGILLLRTGWSLIQGLPAARTIPAGTGEAIAWAILFLVIPQVPLTLGNSVFACADAASTYFPDHAARVKPRALLADLGLLNIGAAALGTYPLCHGSGGVTAHYSFGGRTGGTVVLAGLFYLALALLGAEAPGLLAMIPNGLLGLALAYIGVCHAGLLRSLRGRAEWGIALAAGALGGVTGNLAWALVLGWLAEATRRFAARRLASRRSV